MMLAVNFYYEVQLRDKEIYTIFFNPVLAKDVIRNVLRKEIVSFFFRLGFEKACKFG